jgi:hypothetical protein
LDHGAPSILRACGTALRLAACAAVVCLFCRGISRFHLPYSGFTSLIEFGSQEHARYLPELKAADHYEETNSGGYDGQWYAQIAMRPRLGDPLLSTAVDNLPYRARRILFEWVAWALGGGDPTRALNAFAGLNLACWFLLAALLLRWFPPGSWENVLRWAAMLFSFGLIFSVRSALMDGPSLLLIACAMALVERGRPWWGALVLGVAGLGKETAVIAGASLAAGRPGKPRDWLLLAAKAALVAGPLVLWCLYLKGALGTTGTLGQRNFSAPFLGIAAKAREVLGQVSEEGFSLSSHGTLDLLVLVGLVTQGAFLAYEFRWKDPWWRLGAGFALLMVFLGDAVWEGFPSAAPRVLLPMTLAFNVLVPRGWRLLPLLLLGNIGVLGSAELLEPLPPRGYLVTGPHALRAAPDGDLLTVTYSPGDWWPIEREGNDTWHWGRGEGRVTLHNPQAFALVGDLSFGLATGDKRRAIVTQQGRVLWSAPVLPGRRNDAAVANVRIPPGDSELQFQSDRPAAKPGPGDEREITYSVRDLTINLTGGP